jgi:hypothetical protein
MNRCGDGWWRCSLDSGWTARRCFAFTGLPNGSPLGSTARVLFEIFGIEPAGLALHVTEVLSERLDNSVDVLSDLLPEE